MKVSRRGFLAGLASALAAPAIVPVENLMALPARLVSAVSFRQISEYSPDWDGPIDRMDVLYGSLNVRPEWIAELPSGNNLLTVDQITRESVKLWKNSNTFLRSLEVQYDEHFAQEQAVIGAQLRLRMLEEHALISGDQWEKLPGVPLSRPELEVTSFNLPDLRGKLPIDPPSQLVKWD